jgi:two-component system nitrate/nitrite response regulator NarL
LGARENPIATATEIATFRQQFAHGRIVVLADSHNPDEATLAFRAGAHGYLAKIDCHKDLLASLELVMKGETIMRSLSPPLAMYKPLRLNSGPYSEHSSNDDDLDSGRMSDRADDGEAPRFSSREKVILRYLVAGAPNKLIAREIGTAESTVKVHVKAILRKARVLNRTQAAIWAARNYKLLALDAESERLGRSREIDAA